MILGKRHNKQKIIILCACNLALFCIHMTMGLYMKGTLISGDEMGYLGIARYLSRKGVMPNMAETMFHHAGYSFLISPAFLLSTDPTRI